LAKEEKFMETIKARVTEHDEKHFIEIQDVIETITIPISEDKPNDVKRAFNRLIERIKVGSFEIELEDEDESLFLDVAREYIIQLNREIQEVRGEMIELRLVEDDFEV
jgi:hypothetical protein